MWSTFLFVKSGECISTRTESASCVILADEKRKTHTRRERQREGGRGEAHVHLVELIRGGWVSVLQSELLTAARISGPHLGTPISPRAPLYPSPYVLVDLSSAKPSAHTLPPLLPQLPCGASCGQARLCPGMRGDKLCSLVPAHLRRSALVWYLIVKAELCWVPGFAFCSLPLDLS